MRGKQDDKVRKAELNFNYGPNGIETAAVACATPALQLFFLFRSQTDVIGAAGVGVH